MIPIRASTWLALMLAASAPAGVAASSAHRPHVLLITVDTLRVDHLSAYGYPRPTTPRLDRLLAAGARFDDARTVEPLTAPALASLLTAVHPHEHGASRNGLRMKAGLASLPKALQAHGYVTAAFVGNWTLRDKLTGLGEHFERYDEILTRRRWWGISNGEATGEDLTDVVAAFIEERHRAAARNPWFVWVHYTEPHAPYRAHSEFREPLGLPRKGDLTRQERYATEVAYVDATIGRLLDTVDRLGLTRQTLVVFAADHGESLGEHGYWGHGRNLYEPTLRVPLGLVWPGQIAPRILHAPALLIDLPPTILGLLGESSPPPFRGLDWTPVLHGAPEPRDRVTHHQAHRGVVLSTHDSGLARRSGLLEVASIQGRRKEIFNVRDQRRETYDLTTDPSERRSDVSSRAHPSEALLSWMRSVYEGLLAFDDTPPTPLDEESVERLRSLGYVD